MEHSHRPPGPRQPALWQPLPLRVPVDRPGRDPALPSQKIRHPTEDEDELDQESVPADDGDEVGGKHVIVIDLA